MGHKRDNSATYKHVQHDDSESHEDDVTGTDSGVELLYNVARRAAAHAQWLALLPRGIVTN